MEKHDLQQLSENDKLLVLDGKHKDRIGTPVEYKKGWVTLREEGSNETFRVRPKQVAKVEEPTGKEAMSAILKRYRNGYQPTVAASGKKSLNNGDDLAKALAGLDHDTVMDLAEDLLELPKGELRGRYARLNNGQKRMNAGNRLRAAIKKGNTKVIAWVEAQNKANEEEEAA